MGASKAVSRMTAFTQRPDDVSFGPRRNPATAQPSTQGSCSVGSPVISETIMSAVESLLSVRKVAKLLGLCERTIWKLLAAQRIPEPVRIGHSVRFRASQINDWISAGCPASADMPQEGQR